MEDLRMYTTQAGEIPKLVANNIVMCFVEYTQYLELKAEFDKPKEEDKQ